MSNFLQDGLETPALSGFDVTFFLKKAVIYNVKSMVSNIWLTYLYNVSHSAHTSVAGWLGGQVVQINAKVIIEKNHFR